MAKFRMLGGTHVEEGRNYTKKGDIISSDRDLPKMFANKFERVDRFVEEEEEESVDSPMNDVTDLFQSALDRGLQVTRRRHAYFVIDEGEQLNQDPLKKIEVDSFIQEI